MDSDHADLGQFTIDDIPGIDTSSMWVPCVGLEG